MPKNISSKGGGAAEKIAFKFRSDSICNNANISARMAKTGISKVLKIQILPGEHAPGSLHYYTPDSNSTPPAVSLQNTARGMSTLFGLCWSILKRLNN